MDFQNFSSQITVFLAPFLPYLVSGAESAVKELGKKFGEVVAQKAESIFQKIKERSQNQKLNQAMSALSEAPNDEDLQIIFAKSLARHLEANPQFASELAGLLKEDKSVQSILVEQKSKVDKIRQRLSTSGKQETVIRESQVGDISQEQ